MNTSQVLGR